MAPSSVRLYLYPLQCESSFVCSILGFDALVWSWCWHYVTSRSSDWLQVHSAFSLSIVADRAEVAVWEGAQNTAFAPSRRHFHQGLITKRGRKQISVLFFSFLGGVGSWARMAESEADTPSTPIEFESKYFEFDGVRLPPFCRGKMEEIADFSLRSSDIWIVTYPKSGPFLPSLVPCTLHVRMSLQEYSSSRIMTKANMFLSSITNIYYALFLSLCCIWRPRPICIRYYCHSSSVFVWTLRKRNADDVVEYTQTATRDRCVCVMGLFCCKKRHI